MIFGYMRISTKKENQSTDRQLFALMKYAAENKFTFDKILKEIVSGNIKAENREEYKKLKYMLRKDDILVITDLDRLENKFTFDKILKEIVSGNIKAENREEYKKLKYMLRKDDILVITDLDRLGRNADDVIMELKELKSLGVRVIALDMPYMSDWNKANDDSIYDMVVDIIITIKAHMAQQEREKIISRRVIALDMPYMSDWNKANDDSIYDMVVDIIITIKAHMAQQEREKIISRINQGLDVARANGKKLSMIW